MSSEIAAVVQPDGHELLVAGEFWFRGALQGPLTVPIGGVRSFTNIRIRSRRHELQGTSIGVPGEDPGVELSTVHASANVISLHFSRFPISRQV
jgi:hypothetical protein